MTYQKNKILLTSLIFFSCIMFFSGFLFIKKQSVSATASTGTPIIWSISDAVKPNETVTISGYALYGADLTVAYAPNVGVEPESFDEQNKPQNCTYVSKSKLTAVDVENGTGLMFTLPISKPCAMYDVWVKANGIWSDGITLNATRPLYINQEASYAGLPIEIVGRNFFQSEYGIGTDETSLSSLRVKLTRVADINGLTDNVNEEHTVGVESGVRYPAMESVTGEAIAKSNPYKITFITPNVENSGTYKVFVASDGNDFRGLKENQQLIIYPKKAQNWNESVFGSLSNNTHIGNDPLDLQSYWAQDLNYTNIETITPNAPNDTTLLTKVAQAANRLKEKGGGVIYFPEGNYYLTQCASFYENVIWVGAGADKTKIYYSAENLGGGSWIKANGVSNVGFARMTFAQANPDLQVYPDAILNLSDTAGKTAGGAIDASLQSSKNKFVTDVVINFPYDTTYVNGTVITNQRRYCNFAGAKNFVFQKVQYMGSDFPVNCNVYEFVNIRNARLYSNDAEGFMRIMSNYVFLENVLFEKDWHGHGISLRNNASVSSCYVSKVGNPSLKNNIGEALVFEPAPGFYSVGTITSATNRTFTINMLEGTEITDVAPTLACNNFAIQIISGKGSGQMRYFKRVPVSENCYELLDGEKSWDVIPDESSRYTIIVPMENATVYRFKAENCVKGIYLYSQMFDTVVAECDLKNTEGVLLYSVSIPNNGRFNSNANVRIVNNRIQGVSPGSNKGGINIRFDSVGNYSVNGFGTIITGVEVKGNSLIDISPINNYTGVTSTEQSIRCGIVIDYVGGYDATTDSCTDIKFVTIENNNVSKSQHGIFYEVASSCAVIRNNAFSETAITFTVENARIKSAHIVNGFESIDENETERLPISIGDSNSEIPDDGNSGTEIPDDGNSGTEIPDDGNSGTEIPDDGNSGTETPDDGGDLGNGDSNSAVNTGDNLIVKTKKGCASNMADSSVSIVCIGLVLGFFIKHYIRRKN